MATAIVERRLSRRLPLSRAAYGAAKLLLLGVSVLFLASGAFKLQDRDAFAFALRSQGLLPNGLIPVAVWTVLSAELVCGSFGVWCVLRRRWIGTRIGAVVCAVVFLAFTGYAVGLVVSPPSVPAPCGCVAAKVEAQSWWPIAARNGVLASILSAIGMIPGPRRPGSELPVTTC